MAQALHIQVDYMQRVGVGVLYIESAASSTMLFVFAFLRFDEKPFVDFGTESLGDGGRSVSSLNVIFCASPSFPSFGETGLFCIGTVDAAAGLSLSSCPFDEFNVFSNLRP